MKKLTANQFLLKAYKLKSKYLTKVLLCNFNNNKSKTSLYITLLKFNEKLIQKSKSKIMENLPTPKIKDLLINEKKEAKKNLKLHDYFRRKNELGNSIILKGLQEKYLSKYVDNLSIISLLEIVIGI